MQLPNFKNIIPYLKENFPEIKKNLFGTKGIVWASSIFAALFLIVIIVQSCTPRKGNILYGMCAEFSRLHVPYPHTLKFNQIEMYRKAVRIYFTHIDAFGEYQLQMLECSFLQDPQKGVQLDRVYFDHVLDITRTKRSVGKGKLYRVKQQHIDLFNKSLSPRAILLSDPDLVIPDGTAIYYY